MLVHNGKKDIQCQVCHKTFALKHHLNLHMVTHTKDKLFKCDLCEKVFTQKSSVKTHMLVHTGKNILNVSYVKINFLKKLF